MKAYLEAQRRVYDYHFLMGGKSAENPYYKIDALVWTNIFMEKVPRYSDKVYKMSEYFIQHYKYLKTLSYEQIEQCDVHWSPFRVGFNYTDKIVKYNVPLTEEEFEQELNSPYAIKQYHYDFIKPTELEMNTLKKTFVNYRIISSMIGKDKTVTIDALKKDNLNSHEREELQYRMQLELEDYQQTPLNDKKIMVKNELTPLQVQFSIWMRSFMLPMNMQIQEQAERHIKRKMDEKIKEMNKDNVWM